MNTSSMPTERAARGGLCMVGGRMREKSEKPVLQNT